jgi:hypothetical protein
MGHLAAADAEAARLARDARRTPQECRRSLLTPIISLAFHEAPQASNPNG